VGLRPPPPSEEEGLSEGCCVGVQLQARFQKKKEGNKEALPWMSWEIGANSDHEYFFSWQWLAI
jgi:hypothetical protein